MESLTDIIVELIKNSLDANASSIAIRICLELFWIQILDNGDGINEEDLQSIGKCCLLNIDHDRKNPSKQFARLTGETLLYVISKCEEVQIESVEKSNNKSHSRRFKQSSDNSVCEDFQPKPKYHQCARKSAGTTVTLKNIYYQDTDRKRDYSVKEDFENLLTTLRSFALIHHNRSFTLQDLRTSEVVFRSKRLVDFLPKYCELFHLTETDIDVTTCRKDDVLIECYFSERQIRQSLSPIQLTFINGLPSSELSPTVEDILTQQKHNIDFVIKVTFSKNNVLTQLNQPIIKNCLFRCLNQYKVCLKQRKERTHFSSPSTALQNASSRRAMKDFADKRKQIQDEEDILYGLSQPPDDRQTTFDKCTKWLKTNYFGLLADASPIPDAKTSIPAKTHKNNGARQKMNFFGNSNGVPPITSKEQDDKKETTSPKYKFSAKCPIPKFYSGKEIDLKNSTEKIEHSNARQVQSTTKNEHRSENESFLNMAEEINYSKISLHEETSLEPNKTLQTFTEHNAKRHFLPHTFSPLHPEANKTENKTSNVSSEFEEFNKLNNAINESPQPNENSFGNQIPEEKVEPIFEFSSIQGKNPTMLSNISCGGISYAFDVPLFLAPVEQNDTYNINSPKARFDGLNLVESYIDFRNACQETTQHFQIALEPIDSSDSSDCECSRENHFDREIEKLRQPFHSPRNILAKVGNRRDGA